MYNMTDRQSQVLVCLGHGADTARIGRVLDITDNTVKSHVHALMLKFNVGTRLELGIIAIAIMKDNGFVYKDDRVLETRYAVKE